LVKKQSNKRNQILANIVTVTTWMYVGIAFLWYVFSLFSLLFFNLFLDKLYIPEMVKVSSYSIALVIFWTIIVYGLSMTWEKYNSYLFKKKKQNVSTQSQIAYINERITWSEAILSNITTENILMNRESVKNSLVVLPNNDEKGITNLHTMDSQKLLSIATGYIKKRKYSNAISILRIILGRENVSAIIVNIAEIKLSHCLYELGFEEVASSLAQ
jgi:hypothetical protein